MKKCLLIMLCFALCACAKQDTQNDNVDIDNVDVENNNVTGVTWDCVEYDTIEEMNAAVGTNIVSVSIDGVTDEWFGVISKNLAQYKFTVDDEEWCVRASMDVDNDISGIYDDSIVFEKGKESIYYCDEYYLFRFFYNDIQYVISLNVSGKDISRSYFDDVCYEFKTNITGTESGYDNEIYENGNDVVYKATVHEDGATIIIETIYTFENDKMISITSNTIFETEDAAKEYYDLLLENGTSSAKLVLNGITVISDSSDNVDFYSDLTKEAFIKQMNDSIKQ